MSKGSDPQRICYTAKRGGTRSIMKLRIDWLLLCSIHLCFALSLVHHPTHDNTTYEASTDPQQPANTKQIRWSENVFSYVHSLNCQDVFFTTQRQCEIITQLQRHEVNIYMADPTGRGDLFAITPDGGLSKAGGHDGVIVFDPYPSANFGHLVIVFFLDLDSNRMVCQNEGGTYIGNGECLTLALKKRCKNALEKRRRRNYAKRCEINFLPRVFLEHERETTAQRLTCRSNIPGFGVCPQMRSINETADLICNPLRDNTIRCETTHETTRTSCRPFEICDQAMIISGGWNRQISLPRHKRNILNVYNMLRNNGFRKKHVKVFFANGIDGTEVTGEESQDIHPAAMKLAMRYHLQRMCTSLHCVESLVLYLNSPATADGSSLLWDVDKNGIASENERYTVEELLSDLTDCQARQVHLIVDQSYSGNIAQEVQKSKHHRNVIVYASGSEHEYSWLDDYTHYWVTANHTETCTQQIHRKTKSLVLRSDPEMVHGGRDFGEVSQKTIFGAPCNVRLPFTRSELHRQYFGCQNLPTGLWIMKYMDKPINRQHTTSVTVARHGSNSEQ
ncbi:unnamed protein product [Owenia fusiformis]|uniref:Uncharacterized protein n=1 Tax=Owenia fusiformis TaxID=6347 RepID=A0A8J1TSZ9_OWEFU|nr:unnamed protein product [Owenia fusiformis]